MPTVLVILAPGAEEIETVTIADVLVRAGCQVTVASLSDHPLVTGSRGLLLGAALRYDEVADRSFDLVYLPGGKGSAEACCADARVQDLAERQLASGRLLAVICASPTALLPRGLARGRRLTSYPGVRSQLEAQGALWSDQPVVLDGNLASSQGAGSSLHFALALARTLCGAATAHRVAHEMVVPPGSPLP